MSGGFMIGKQWIHQSVCGCGWRCLSRLDKAYLHPIPKVVSNSTPERVKFSSIKQFSLLPILMLAGILAGCGGGDSAIADVSEQTATVATPIAASTLIAPTNLASLVSDSRPPGDGIASSGAALTQNGCVFSSLGQTSQTIDGFTLITDDNACRIIGAPITISGGNSSQLLAISDQGQLVTLKIPTEVLEKVPDLQVLIAQSYSIGAPVSVEPVNAGGGELTGCSVNKPLPNGLSVTTNAGNDSCVITGTPDTITTATDFDITATNAIGSSTVIVNIAVVSDIASFATPEALVYAVGDSVNESFTNTNAVGSRVSGCTGALPAGLSVDALTSPGNGCALTGTPTTATAPASYTITATTAGGDTALTLDITVTNAAPPRNLRTPITSQIAAGLTTTYAINSAGQLFGWGNNHANQLGLGNPGNPLYIVSTPALLTGNDWAQVTVGFDHTCAINASGQLFCWGEGDSGVLGLGNNDNDGDGYNDNVNTPARVGDASDWAQISAGSGHTCAVKTSGQLWCWGYGGEGGLGLGNNLDTHSPERVGRASDWMQVSAGYAHTCAVKASGQLFCWGDDSAGRVYFSNNTYANAPVRVGSASDWAQVSAGRDHTCAIKESGQLWCWGYGVFGQLGLGNNTYTNTPARAGDASDWIQVSASSAHTCAIKASGQLWCWGDGRAGQLGLGRYSSTNRPARVGNASDWAQVSADGYHTCAIKASGQPWCWGHNGSDRLGLGSDISDIGVNIPTLVRGIPLRPDITVNPVAPNLERMVKLNLILNSNVGLPFAIANTGGSPTTCTAAPTAAGDDALGSYNLTVLVADSTCVIDSLDGNGPSRTLDGGSFTITATNASGSAAATLTLNLRNPVTFQISGGSGHTFAINSAGQLFGWGSNSENQLGLGDLDDSLNSISTPILFTGNDWEQVASGTYHTCAIKESGQLLCWGWGANGRLGLGYNNNTNTPTQVGDASDWMQVASGGSHTCAIKESGQLWCWGAGAFGRLGLGYNTDTNTPTQVGDASDWMQVSAGDAHTCAIKESGQLWCWGWGANGRLGLGYNTDTNTPTQVGDASDWMQVVSGNRHTCAIKESGQLWCWGDGEVGQLGLGNNDNDGDGYGDDVNTPTQVGDASDWMQVSAGVYHTCAIKESGQLWCWGSGTSGQLGLGNNSSTNTPMRVDGASDWMQVNAGNFHTCAIKASGQLWCWGWGVSGQLGLGSNTSKNIPTLVRGIPLRPDITVNPATTPLVAPNLSTASAQTYAQNIAITALVLTNTGGDVTASTGCTVDTSGGKPDLPTGLSVGVVSSGGTRTCQITGTPVEVVSTARTVTIAATNTIGSAIVAVSIIVNSGIVPDSLSTYSLFLYEVGQTVSNTRQITFTNTGGAIQSCTAPDLPDGMSINSADCTISGAPSRTTAERTTHTITATYTDSATSEATILIETYLSCSPPLYICR